MTSVVRTRTQPPKYCIGPNGVGILVSLTPEPEHTSTHPASPSPIVSINEDLLVQYHESSGPLQEELRSKISEALVLLERRAEQNNSNVAIIQQLVLLSSLDIPIAIKSFEILANLLYKWAPLAEHVPALFSLGRDLTLQACVLPPGSSVLQFAIAECLQLTLLRLVFHCNRGDLKDLIPEHMEQFALQIHALEDVVESSPAIIAPKYRLAMLAANEITGRLQNEKKDVDLVGLAASCSSNKSLAEKQVASIFGFFHRTRRSSPYYAVAWNLLSSFCSRDRASLDAVMKHFNTQIALKKMIEPLMLSFLELLAFVGSYGTTSLLRSTAMDARSGLLRFASFRIDDPKIQTSVRATAVSLLRSVQLLHLNGESVPLSKDIFHSLSVLQVQEQDPVVLEAFTSNSIAEFIAALARNAISSKEVRIWEYFLQQLKF